MNTVHRSRPRSRKAIRGLALAMGLAALAPASAQATATVQTHPVTHTVTPQAVPQPTAPTGAPAPSTPASPSMPPAPSSSTQNFTGGNGFSPSQATYGTPSSPTDDVGHNAGQSQEIPIDPQDLAQSIMDDIALLQIGIDTSHNPDPVDLSSVKAAWQIAWDEYLLEINHAESPSKASHEQTHQEDAPPETQSGEGSGSESQSDEDTGSGGGGTDSACGPNTRELNAETEDPGNGVALC